MEIEVSLNNLSLPENVAIQEMWENRKKKMSKRSKKLKKAS
jgi:hypothetical protein